MSEMKISLSNIRNTRTLYIEDIDKAFTVRKLGAGEELDLSDKMRRLGEILKELRSIDFTKYDANREEDLKEIEDINSRASELTKEVAEIQRFELDTYKKCFEDNNGGKDVDMLLDTLSTDERVKLFNQLFDIKTVEAPQSVAKSEVEPEPKEDIKTAQKPSKKPVNKKTNSKGKK